MFSVLFAAHGETFPSRSASVAVGVGHPLRGSPKKSLPDVRSAEARRRHVSRPDGSAKSFHVSRYNVEPRPSERAFNLLAKND